CRRTSAAKAASSRWVMKHCNSCPSVIPRPSGRRAALRTCLMTPLNGPVVMSIAPLPGNASLLSVPRETGPARRFFRKSSSGHSTRLGGQPVLPCCLIGRGLAVGLALAFGVSDEGAAEQEHCGRRGRHYGFSGYGVLQAAPAA